MKYVLILDVTPEHCKDVKAVPSFVVSDAMMTLATKIHNGQNAPGINTEKPGSCDVQDYQGNKIGTWAVVP